MVFSFNLDHVFPPLGTALFKGEMCYSNEFGIAMWEKLTYIKWCSKYMNNRKILESLKQKHPQCSTGRVSQVKGVRRYRPEPIYSFFFSLKLSSDTSSITNWNLQARNHSHHDLLTKELMLNSCQIQFLGWKCSHKKALGCWVWWESRNAGSLVEVLWAICAVLRMLQM